MVDSKGSVVVGQPGAPAWLACVIVMPEHSGQGQDALKDPDQDPGWGVPAHVLIVTLPEATPVHEAAALQGALRRAGSEPAARGGHPSPHAAGGSAPVPAARAPREARPHPAVTTPHGARPARRPAPPRRPPACGFVTRTSVSESPGSSTRPTPLSGTRTGT